MRACTRSVSIAPVLIGCNAPYWVSCSRTGVAAKKLHEILLSHLRNERIWNVEIPLFLCSGESVVLRNLLRKCMVGTSEVRGCGGV